MPSAIHYYRTELNIGAPCYKVQECDATAVPQSAEAGNTKNKFYKSTAIRALTRIVFLYPAATFRGITGCVARLYFGNAVRQFSLLSNHLNAFGYKNIQRHHIGIYLYFQPG
mgnify:FL=1